MKILYGDMISFVISASSIVLAVLPILIIPDNRENIDANLIQIQRAKDISHNNTASVVDKLWSFNKLQLNLAHVNPDISKLIINDNKGYLARAVLSYNNGDIKKALMDYNNTKIDKKGTIDLDTWYKMKVFSNEKNLNDSSGPISNSIEDINCVDNRTKQTYTISEGTCKYSQLQQINSNLKNLVQSGNTSDFFNTENTVLSLQKPIEVFVNDLNYFIIGSIITGPIIFFLAAKHIFRGK